MILSIDTTDTQNIKVELKNSSNKILSKITENQQKGSQVLLPMISEILIKNKLTLKDIREVEVNPGPGSFTGTRVGVSVANALGFGLEIPVNGKKGKIVLPIYEKSKYD